MKKIDLTSFVISSILLLSACKSLSDMRTEGAKSTFSSNKNVQDVSECILYGWQEKRFLTGPMHAYIQPHKNGKTVYVDEYIWVADVFPGVNEGRSEVKYYTQSKGRNKEMQDVIQSCI
ncbi:TPA: hypothetical protein MEF11_000271 [Klebsiella pneumoniae]|nr:hypothetical protein [Klebsiella pneumoniae]